MGWETVVLAGFNAMQAVGQVKQGKAEAKAIAREAEINASNVAQNTLRTAGDLKVSFLQSGLTLEGGPTDILTQAFEQGYTDIGRIKSNADASIKNTMSKARTAALTTLAKGAVGQSIMSGVSSFADGFSSGFSDGFNNAATYQTGATPGVGNTWSPPWQANAPLPWRT